MNGRKGSLTFAERITAAYLHYVQYVDQQVIATAYGVNQGRVAEACKAIKRAAEMPLEVGGGDMPVEPPSAQQLHQIETLKGRVP
jgi:hypothetical protein